VIGKEEKCLGKPEEKRTLGRPRRRCDENIQMKLSDGRVWSGFNWLGIEKSGRLS